MASTRPDLDGEYLRELWAACDALGLPTGTAIGEYAAGQYEITLAHTARTRWPPPTTPCASSAPPRASPTGTAGPPPSWPSLLPSCRDRGSAHPCLGQRRSRPGNICRRRGARGVIGTRPRHRRLRQPDAGVDRGVRPQCQQLLGGSGRTPMPRCAPAGASTTAPCRCASPSARRRRGHLEHRLSGADANPYLAVAAVLAGVHHGLTHDIDPGPMVSGDGYALGNACRPTGRMRWRCSKGRGCSPTMGRPGSGEFATMKRVEQERYNAVVHAARL